MGRRNQRSLNEGFFGFLSFYKYELIGVEVEVSIFMGTQQFIFFELIFGL